MRAGSPYFLVIGLLVLASSTGLAQQQPMTVPSLPPAPAALTVPNPFGPPPGSVDLYRRLDNFHSLTPQPPPVFISGPFYVPGYGPGPYLPGPFAPGMYGVVEIPQTRSVYALLKGGLRLETQPDSAQVFVDGYYVGIVEEYGLQGKLLELTAGSHHIELRAPGYGVLSFDVHITASQTSRFRGDLQLLPSPPPTASAVNASSAPRKYYVIPNCYAGDRRPMHALPRGCDLSKLREIR
jgi:PEGA domain-containing protein